MGKKSSTSATTSQLDGRVTQQEGTAASTNVAGRQNTVNVTMLDNGIVSKAIDAVTVSDAINADGFDKLLKTAEGLFTKGEKLIGQTQSAVADAYATAQSDTKATIDNRTVIVLGIAAAGAAAAFALRKK